MKKKQGLTKDDAIILLQSKPLTTSLWQLASDRLEENAIRFPDPSYLDSQTWPDYQSKKQKKVLVKTIAENDNPVLEESSEVSQSIEFQSTNNKLENIDSVFIQEVEIKEEKTIEIVESQIENVHLKKTKSPAKRKTKKKENEILEKMSSANIDIDILAVNTELEKAIPSSKTLDFYEWLEELREQKRSPEGGHVTGGKLKKKTNLTKAAKEIADAKVAAENSLKLGEEIVSETLARLLARQGHREEAKEMYQKLILKYPEKGATFAAALQKLK